MKHLPLILITALIILTNEHAMSESNNISRYYLKLQIENAIAEVKLNDTPIIKNLETEGLVTTEPVNLWLKNDVNKLSYVIFPDKENKSYTPKLIASVFLHDNQQDFPTPLKTLATIDFSEEYDNEKPVTNEVSFEITDNAKLKLWSEAEQISNLSNSDKHEIIDLTNNLQQAILSDSSTAIKLQEFKINEDALADAKTFERLTEVAKENYDWLRSQDDIKATKVSIEDLDFRICGDGKLVNLTRKDQSDALVIESESMYFDVPLFFAKINGNWVIAR